MRNAPALCLFFLAATTLSACATSSPPEASAFIEAPAVLLCGLPPPAPGAERAGPEVVLGAWISQFIRHPPADHHGPPFAYEGGQVIDADRWRSGISST